MKRGLPHEPDPTSPQYAPWVTMAKALAHQHHHLVVFSVADFDYRYLAENWFKAAAKAGMTNAIVYALDEEAHAYFVSKGVRSFDGSGNLAAWNQTRLQRHVQAAEAERHLAAAALAAGGLDVLLTDVTQVILGDVTPMLAAVAKAPEGVDMAVGRGGCNGKPPTGCGPMFNLVFLRGNGAAEQRARAVAWQVAGVKKGLVDFYLRWWNGAHCILSGYGKLYSGSCNPRLEGGVLPQDVQNLTATHTVTVALSCEGGVRFALLPEAFYPVAPLYGPSGGPRPPSLLARSSKPAQRDRLRLDRYDEQDFVELEKAMRADRLWFL